MDKACLEIRDLLALGPDTSSNERIAIESHVSVCAECARALAESRTLIGNLALLREGEMPAGAAERIWRGVQSAVPGSRRPAILQWSARVAAMLVIGLSIGYTTRSVADRLEPGAVAEEPSLDDPRPTFVPSRLSRGAVDGGVSDPVPPATPMGAPSFMVVPRAWSLHHLPYVDEILGTDVVRF